MVDTFPRQYARTRRLTLGDPRGFRVSPDDERVVFLRSRGGNDSVTCLWVLDVDASGGKPSKLGAERLVADPLALFTHLDGELPVAEKARRERQRESADGITSFATDKAVALATFTVQGRLFVADITPVGTGPRSILPNGVFDPRLSPDSAYVAYLTDRALRVCRVDGTDDRQLAGEDDVEITWGQADFVAAEELDRYRGFWWSPDSTAVVAARVDTTAVQRWHICDPANPERPPTVHRYPAAGTANAVVTLAIVTLDGLSLPIEWDHVSMPYLVDVAWADAGLHIVVMDRVQSTQHILRIDPATGHTHKVREEHHPIWIEKPPGTPAWLRDGRVVRIAPIGESFTLCFGDTKMTSPDEQARRVVHVGDDFALVVTNDATTPWQQSVRVVPEGREIAQGGAVDMVVGNDIAVIRTSTMTATSAVVSAWRHGRLVGEIASFAEVALVDPRPSFALLRGLPVSVLLPQNHPSDEPLPVLMNPYGGPHAQMVVAARGAHLTSQWLADQGFAVVVVDGRGTPGRGVSWEHAVRNDLAQPVLDDQVEGLHAAAERYPQLDLSRVGIRGWSFGGYLAALAVLRRPDVFHAAIAGAPVTEWRLYDTGYTERYLGQPSTNSDAYDRSSLLHDAHRLERPLMLVHGLADDNVVAAHTLRLSSALLAAGKPHEVLPLSGVTHMTPQEVVAENLLLLQVEFLKRHLSADRAR